MVSNEHADIGELAVTRCEEAHKQINDVLSSFAQEISSFGELKVTPFKQSYKISTYLYCICAGPFSFWERNTEGFPPMRIYARKSLIADVNYEEMFTVT